MRRLGVSALVLYLSVLSFLSLNPWFMPDGAPVVAGLTWDLLDHAVAYGGLSLLILMGLKSQRIGFRTSLVVVGIAGLIGILLEVSQGTLTTTRLFSVWDASANVVGALLGTLIYWFGRILILPKAGRKSGL